MYPYLKPYIHERVNGAHTHTKAMIYGIFNQIELIFLQLFLYIPPSLSVSISHHFITTHIHIMSVYLSTSATSYTTRWRMLICGWFESLRRWLLHFCANTSRMTLNLQFYVWLTRYGTFALLFWVTFQIDMNWSRFSRLISIRKSLNSFVHLSYLSYVTECLLSSIKSFNKF